MSRTPIRALVPALVVLAVALTGCSGGSDSNASGDSGAAGGRPAVASAPEEAPAGAPADGVRGEMDAAFAADLKDEPSPDLPGQALIRRGNVALEADDVGKAQFDVQKVVDRYDGKVTEEKTTTGDDGKPAYTRMVLRIPSGDFDRAMEALKGVAELESANTSEDDVTTKVIDVQSRLKVQRRSIARITTLFDRAQSIRDIMAIESQLSGRQAELESLERQAAYLANQTSLSTIVVSIDQIVEKSAKPKEEDHAGFLAGLSAGWHGLTATAVALATVLGALLPWLVVLVVLGPPALLLGRTVRRRRTHPAPEPAEG